MLLSGGEASLLGQESVVVSSQGCGCFSSLAIDRGGVSRKPKTVHPIHIDLAPKRQSGGRWNSAHLSLKHTL